MIPDIKKKEWVDILTGSLKAKLTILSFQMKLSSLQIDIRLKAKSLDEAISELHRFISSDEKKYQKDIDEIFKSHQTK